MLFLFFLLQPLPPFNPLLWTQLPQRAQFQLLLEEEAEEEEEEEKGEEEEPSLAQKESQFPTWPSKKNVNFL